MPGEFEPHAGCWMAWPERPDNWRQGAKPAQRAFAAVAEAINVCEPVTVAVSDAQFEHCRALLSPSIRVVELSTDDAWMRDTGPTFLLDDRGGRRGVDWRFNAWGGLDGGLYFPWDRDERVAAKVLEIEGADRYRAPIVLEGGSIHVDGEGTVLSDRRVPAEPEPQPRALSRADRAGAVRVPRRGEDDLARPRRLQRRDRRAHRQPRVLRAPGVVLLSWLRGRADPQHAISRDAQRAPASGATDARGRAIEVIRLPSPGPLTITERGGRRRRRGRRARLPRRAGDRLAASYVNFYPANERIVFPLLDERYDEQAAEVLRGCFPEREVVGVPAREILLGGGNIHCITQQVPALG